jgi:hypothetical protein
MVKIDDTEPLSAIVDQLQLSIENESGLIKILTTLRRRLHHSEDLCRQAVELRLFGVCLQLVKGLDPDDRVRIRSNRSALMNLHRLSRLIDL